MMTTHDHDEPPPGFFDDFDSPDNVMPLVIPADRLPPHDLEAERALLAIVVCSSTTEPIRRLVRPEHLYLDGHRRIYAAALALEVDGRVPDAVTIRGYLADRGELQRVGGSQAIVELLSVPTASHPEEYARRVRDKHALRQTIDIARRVAAEGYSATDVQSLIAGARRLLDGVEADPAAGIELVPKGALAAPLPAIPWVVPELYIAPGRPTMISGYGYSGKTVAVQDMMISVSMGIPVWGRYRVQRPGRCLHIDHEQGRRATLLRYQRLARARGVDLDALDQVLDIAVLPRSFRLSRPDAEDVLERACEGVVLCAIDSLHASTPGVDEIDAGISDHVSKLLSVSDRTGTAFVLVHHDGKGGKDKDAKERTRGSSAIYAACGTVLSMRGEVDESGATTVRIEMTKTGAEAAGAALQPFALRIDDVLSEEGQERWGLECRQMTLEQVDPPKSPRAARDDHASRVLDALRREPGMSGRELAKATGIRRDDLAAVLDYLQRTDKVERTKRQGQGGGALWTAKVADE